MSFSFKTWFEAFRPKTLWAGVGPVLIGTAMAYTDKAGHWILGLMALYCSLMFQVGSNLANDYFDHRQGSDKNRRLGPVRPIHTGRITPRQVRAAFILVFLSTLPIGLYFLWIAGWPLLLVGAASVLAAVLYTARPVAFGYHGWGEVFVLLFFGPVAVAGTYYVQTLRITPAVLAAGLAPGLLAAAILVVNNLRDRESDLAAGKRTLAVQAGETFSRWEYTALVVLGCLIPVFLVLAGARHPYSLLATASLLPALPAIGRMHALHRASPDYGKRMNQLLAQTSRLLLLYSVLFSLGWLL